MNVGVVGNPRYADLPAVLRSWPEAPSPRHPALYRAQSPHPLGRPLPLIDEAQLPTS